MLRTVLLTMTLLLLAAPAIAQETIPNTEDARREAERIAREKAREEERKRESDARMEEFRRLRPPTPAERAREHKRRFPEFMKNLRGFEAAARDFRRAAPQDSEKKAKALYDRSRSVLDYIAYEQKIPEAPPSEALGKPLPERTAMVQSASAGLMPRLRKWADGQRKSLLDINQSAALIRDLQSLRQLTRSLYR